MYLKSFLKSFPEHRDISTYFFQSLGNYHRRTEFKDKFLSLPIYETCLHYKWSILAVLSQVFTTMFLYVCVYLFDVPNVPQTAFSRLFFVKHFSNECSLSICAIELMVLILFSLMSKNEERRQMTSESLVMVSVCHKESFYFPVTPSKIHISTVL